MVFDPPIPSLIPARTGDEARFRFTLQEGAFAGKSFTASLLICSNPCCGCETITFYCHPDEIRPGAADVTPTATAPVRADLNVMSRSAYERDGSSPLEHAFSRAFAVELSLADWVQWQDVFLTTKRRQIDAADLATIDAWFPPDVKEGNGTMVGFAEVFPWAAAFEFPLGTETWFVDDQYCVDPACDCREAVLSFFRAPYLPKQRQRPLQCISVLRYEYLSGKTIAVERKYLSPEPAAFMAALQAAHAEGNQIMERRHQQMKQLAQRLIPAHVQLARRAYTFTSKNPPLAPAVDSAAPPPKPVVKAGRNDPCPCGSGKKFKKCCGR